MASTLRAVAIFQAEQMAHLMADGVLEDLASRALDLLTIDGCGLFVEVDVITSELTARGWVVWVGSCMEDDVHCTVGSRNPFLE